jgi:hypothetical protein
MENVEQSITKAMIWEFECTQIDSNCPFHGLFMRFSAQIMALFLMSRGMWVILFFVSIENRRKEQSITTKAMIWVEKLTQTP